MKKCAFISLYAAIDAHKSEFVGAIQEGCSNAILSMSLPEIKEAFAPNKLANTKALAKVA